jgi:hypothetical protein
MKTVDWLLSGALIIAILAVLVGGSSKTSDAIGSFMGGVKSLIDIIMSPSIQGNQKAS